VCNSGHLVIARVVYAVGAMVESNLDEERSARIENMVETLRRESAARKIVQSKFVTIVAVVAHAPELVRLKSDA
jgi:hypothetical protein